MNGKVFLVVTHEWEIFFMIYALAFVEISTPLDFNPVYS